MITQKMVLNLIDVAKEKGDMDRVKSYWNTYHCQSKIVSSENKLYGNYCKNRYCTICSAIRKAHIINKYYPALKNWKNAHFVTLTVKSVKAKNLKRWIYGMNLAFKIIKNRCNKRHQRGKGIKLIGIKSLECNFNPMRKTYNPHFHLIVPNKEIADLLKKEWMHQWNKTTTLHSSHKAQHIRPVESIERDLIETIKYGSKIFTEPDLKKKAQRNIAPMIYIYALDNILSAMKGYRIFERFGFNLPKEQKNKSPLKFINNFDNWEYSIKATDWINTSTGE
ncbi:MAG: protein rep, partial [Flavobacteriaceae bacterium]|nr:protein rep [Flavobacteriaceae bacterium]